MVMIKQCGLNIFAKICALWFIATGWMWVYYMNLVISFPVALVGLYCWYKVRNPVTPSPMSRIVFWLYIVGMIVTLGSLAILLFYN